MSHTEADIRPIRCGEEAKALDLWDEAFAVGRAYFEQYFDRDPWYREGDCLGAWDAGRLVSAVHICRRPVTDSEGRTLLTGGIANVATLTAYRGRGLSRALLVAAIARMEQLQMAYSTLGTGIREHYAAVGWEDLPLPSYDMELSSDASSTTGADSNDLAGAWQQILDAYSASPRPMQIARSRQYFEQWVRPRWQETNTFVVAAEGAYAVAKAGIDDDGDAYAAIEEFRAADAASERDILTRAIERIRGYGPTVRVRATPQFCELKELPAVRPGAVHRDLGMMIRNIGLTAGRYQEVKAEFHSGRSCWWNADNS